MPDQSRPLISVIMPIRNGARFLPNAVDSILNQTLHDFELILIDDGSTDATPEILAAYAARDPRIRIETLPDHQGIVAALNHGCDLARGRYLARMDADDISLPNRLRLQADFLDRHHEIGVVGASLHHIDERGTPGLIVHPPASPGLIRWRAFFACPMSHPTIMLRKALFDQVGGYAAGMAPAEDYDLWLRLSAITDLANLPDVLLLYRVWEGSISSQQSARAHAKAAELVWRSVSDLLGEPVSQADAIALRAVMAQDKSTWPGDPVAIGAVAALLVRVCAAYTGAFPLSRAEMHAIREESAFWLLLLARRVWSTAPRQSARLIVRALRLYPPVVKRVIGRMTGRVQHTLSRRATNTPSPSWMGRRPGGGAG